ncbi:MAG: hypothetical protein MUQ20_04485 [Deltaproteobacteria bacterium]|nr:hypothetical protein [Deltaproteobacteria bacterium]
MDTGMMVREILTTYALPVRGRHGVIHWARVLENGLRLAESTGADVRIVTLFALFHDSCRLNEHYDEGHGLRGGEYARSLRAMFLPLQDPEFELLFQACHFHTDGHTQGDVTLQTCWDADRLDLGRVGITPKPELLCTYTARKLLGWANQRAVIGYEPEIVTKLWGL